MTSGHCKGLIQPSGAMALVGAEIARTDAVLRITELESHSLRVEGRLGGAWVNELRRACELHRPRTLDLRGLQTVDVDGLKLLRQLAVEGIDLQRLSGYLAALLAEMP